MLFFVVRWGGIGRYCILDVEPILYFLVGWGGVGWNWEVLHFGFRAHTIFFGGVGWGRIEKVLQFGITCFLSCGGYDCELP